jgi:hypothetical protein
MAAKDDPTITPDLRLRAAIGLAAYQHPKPFPLKETFVGPIDYAAPKTVQEARAAILELGERMARREISVEAHDALINGIRTYLRRPNNGRSSTSSKSSLRSGDSSRARHSGEPPQARIWADDQRLPADRITQAKLRPTRPSREPLSHRAGRPGGDYGATTERRQQVGPRRQRHHQGRGPTDGRPRRSLRAGFPCRA